MLFNSSSFLIFFVVFISLYFTYGRNNIARRNLLIVVGSYIFYSFWDWRFTFLLFGSSFLDFKIGGLLQKEKVQNKRKKFVFLSIITNLGILFLFKYFNFFSDSLNILLLNLGADQFFPTAKVILPVGISFYTFQSLGYTIDVYRKKINCVNKLIPFLAYVSFFPQLVAGPIERSTNLMPQFFSEREINNEKIKLGFNLIILGLFKKIVIADNAAVVVNDIFANSAEYNGSTLLLGAFFDIALFLVLLPLFSPSLIIHKLF